MVKQEYRRINDVEVREFTALNFGTAGVIFYDSFREILDGKKMLCERESYNDGSQRYISEVIAGRIKEFPDYRASLRLTKTNFIKGDISPKPSLELVLTRKKSQIDEAINDEEEIIKNPLDYSAKLSSVGELSIDNNHGKKLLEEIKEQDIITHFLAASFKERFKQKVVEEKKRLNKILKEN